MPPGIEDMLLRLISGSNSAHAPDWFSLTPASLPTNRLSLDVLLLAANCARWLGAVRSAIEAKAQRLTDHS